ncbi:MAG: HEPN domain-containing protein [Methanofollis sp.]|uniref:HEPN domain-containing protein n=1 Tax=Methanofollis sp. TaxID=2052835 RepID=UPI00261A8F52|nr:HEPN domain-containing protein [Methanofollis sp.]MDD4255184.1 HEPN domain-containing protein [Methanofollis sp.]
MGKKGKPIKKKAHPDLPLAKDTLAIARQDLDAAMCLYDQGYYPQAVFFLQQGVEKGWKAFGYHHGTITLEEARNTKDVGHKGARVGKMAFLKLRDIIGPMISEVKMVRSCIGTSQDGETTAYESYLDNLDKDLHWAQKEIDKVIDSSHTITSDELVKRLERFRVEEQTELTCEDLITSPKFDPEIGKLIRTGAVKEVYALIGGTPATKILINDTINGTFNDQNLKTLLLSVMKGMVIISPLLYFAIITQEHESRCRYPDKGYSPINEYTKNQALIAYFPSIAHTAQASLEKMDELFQLPLIGDQ